MAQSTANTRVRFEQWAKNPECEANTVSTVLNVRMGKVASSLGLPDNKGTGDPEDLFREAEKWKVSFGSEHFQSIEVDYKVTSNWAPASSRQC